MPDVLEEQLATRLRALGQSTPVELEPPADLERRVTLARKEVRSRGYGTLFAIAAAFLVVVAIAAVLSGRTDDAPVTSSPHGDPLPAGTVMLGAKGKYVTARDAQGKILATMVTTTHGEVQEAQVTGDHRAIFYSVTDGHNCLKIARADIRGRTSSFVARANAFAISPDGRRLALSGCGEFDRSVVVRDLVSGATEQRASSVSSRLAWSHDGTVLSGASCGTIAGCTVSLWPDHGAEEVVGSTRVAAFGLSDFYRVELEQTEADGPNVFQSAGGTLSAPQPFATVGAGWNVSDLVPTGSTVLMIATPPNGPTALYRLVDGRVEKVSDANPGATTPVYPMVVSPSGP